MDTRPFGDQEGKAMKEVNFTLCPLTESYKRFLLPPAYSLAFLLGLALNGAMLWSVVSRTRSWSCTIIFLTNLAVADICYVLTLPPLIISYAMENVWLFGNVICKAVRFLFYTNLHCSVMFLTCISVHRFLGVCYPIVANNFRSNKVAVVVSGSVWVLASLETLPTLVFAHTGFIDNMTVCFDMTAPEQFDTYFPYGLFLTLAGFLIPFLITLFCYCSLMRVLCCSAKTADSSRKAHMRNKSARTVLAVCLMFVICFVPYHVAQTVYLFVRVYAAQNCNILNTVMISYKIWKPLISFNCCVNPLLYFLGSCSHRKKLRAWLCSWRWRKRVGPTTVFVMEVSSAQPSEGRFTRST